MAPLAEQEECRLSKDGWTVDTLKQFTMGMIEALGKIQDRQMVDLKVLLQSQFEAKEKADKAQFDAQEKAGQVAFAAQQTALTTGLLTAERGVETALAAAKEATTKAEVNATARFEQFRSESGLQLKTLSDKLDTEIGRVSERIAELATRLNVGAGEGQGRKEAATNTRLDQGQLVGVLGFLVALVAVASQFLQ